MERQVLVRKASGEEVPFDLEKLRSSLVRAGADEEVVEAIVPQVCALLREGISTRLLYKEAYKLLKTAGAGLAGRYKLKEALLELGPSGYPFEKFVGELFRLQGFKVETGVIVAGACVRHEVDVLALRDRLEAMAECKYHNKRGMNTDVKVPLYVHSRFLDIQKAREQQYARSKQHFEGWLVTNTRFSEDALSYGACVGLNLLGWDYPAGRGLRELIWETGGHPITCLSTLTQEEKRKLLEQQVVLCREVLQREDLLHHIGISTARIDKIRKEAGRIIHSKSTPGALREDIAI